MDLVDGIGDRAMQLPQLMGELLLDKNRRAQPAMPAGKLVALQLLIQRPGIAQGSFDGRVQRIVRRRLALFQAALQLKRHPQLRVFALHEGLPCKGEKSPPGYGGPGEPGV
jgi:hypothetical protein